MTDSIPQLIVVPITGAHFPAIRRFDCGERSLNDFLKLESLYYDKVGEGKTALLIDEGNNKIIGYYTIKCSCFKVEDPDMNPDQPRVIPAVEIARFAIDKNHQGKKMGSILFSHLIDYIGLLKNEHIGIRSMILFALPSAVGFYQKFDFEEIDNTVEAYRAYANEECICMYSTISH